MAFDSSLTSIPTSVPEPRNDVDELGARRQRRVPIATYRLQFNSRFTFADAARLVPYLQRLGISDLYCSSYLQAAPGSPHGYDVADPTSLNAEIGSEEDYRAFVRTLRAHGMGQILDIVPNHMGIARSCNPRWQDVLENGASSRYARMFDIDWWPVNPALKDKVLLPILGDQYGASLERQEIMLAYDDGGFFVRYFENVFPLAPRSYRRILGHRVGSLIEGLGEDHPDVLELLSIVTSLDRLPANTNVDATSIAERHREKLVAKRRLATLLRASDTVRAFVDENIRHFNGEPGVPASFDLLDELLNEQSYRLAHWRVASEEINYRRFFDINELAAVRMEEPAVFEETHQLVFRLLAEGAIQGLRVDHVDGLYDPGDYLRRLQSRAQELGLGEGPRPLYLVVEKILGPDEPVPADWPIDGTTGYEFGNEVNGIFVDRLNGRAFDELYRRFTGERTSFAEIVHHQKNLIMQIGMASEINVLAHRLNRLSETNRHYRDFTLNSLAHAIREIIACFPVYRTYVSAGDTPVADRDRTYIDRAVNQAKRRNPALPGLAFDFIRDLLLKRADYIPEYKLKEYRRFVTQFQQTTSPVTAKGIEDTALYVYPRLVSLNEVGGEPSRFGVPPAHLHDWLARRQHDWPAALSATSTHDTKRSEDVRARINVLSEIPGAWKVALARWARLNRKLRTGVDGQVAPDRHEEYLLYQTLLGTWPVDSQQTTSDGDYIERICAYMVKALREAKRNSSWLNPRRPYEEAVVAFVRQVLDPGASDAFLSDLRTLAERVAHAGAWNSLAQTVIKITAPGVPDFYQGTEIWDFSLVDPDNRRPVDYTKREALIDQVAPLADVGPLPVDRLDELVTTRLDGRIKLYAIVRALRTRHSDPELFQQGAYLPLHVTGTRSMHVFAYARVHASAVVLTVVPRLTATLVADPLTPPLGEIWADTCVQIPPIFDPAPLTNTFTGERLSVPPGTRELPLAQVFGTFPVAVLTNV